MKPVRPEDFDADALWKAAEEGRLFIIPMTRSLNEIREENAERVLTYVSSLRTHTADDYRVHIDNIWKELLLHEDFVQNFIMQRGKLAGDINKYFITAIVDCMQNLGVYTGGNTIFLHRILENTQTRNQFYNNMGVYALSYKQQKILQKILQQNKEYKIGII